MEGKRRSPRVDIAIGAKLDFREKGTFEGVVGNLSMSGEGIMVRSSKEALVGETVTLEMPVPIKMETVRCRGEVIDCQESGGNYEIDILIRDIDEPSREALSVFCNLLKPRARLNTIDYLVSQGEKAISEAAEVNIRESIGTRLGAYMHELLSLKYHDALRSFEDALNIDAENEAALEGFCYSLAKAVFHYERAGLSRLAETIKVKALPYCTDKALEIAERSPRMGKYLLGIVRDMMS